MSSRRLMPALLLLPALIAGALTSATSASASAPAGTPTVAVTSGGAAATSVAAGDGLTVTQTAPITLAGQTGQRLQASWDPAQATLSAGAVTRPEGWSLEYTTDGSSWSAIAPADLGTVRGVRSSGAVESNGLSAGLQVSTTTGTGVLKRGFAGSSGGDGWDVFFTSSKVLNVWHHGDSYNLDCHLRVDGSPCGPVYSLDGYRTSGAASGTSVGDKVYSTVGQDESGSVGVLCTDTSASPLTSCGYTPLVEGSSSWPDIGSQSRVGTRLFVPVNSGGEGKLGCFDTATGTACPDQPYALPGFSSIGIVPAFSVADSGRVFVTANQIWCLDAGTGESCSGSWPAGNYYDYYNGVHAAIPMRTTNGTLDGVCMILPAGDCYDLAGAPAAMPTDLLDLLSSHPVGEMIPWAQFGYTSTRQYWFTGWSQPPVCFDWATGAACAGFQQTTPIGDVRYSIVADPNDSGCMWSNGDNGQIAPFDGLTGEPRCAASDPTVTLPYTTVVPRLSCGEAGRVRGWQSMALHAPPGVTPSDLRVGVRDEAGTPVPGWDDLTPDGTGVIDLTALPVSATGTRPSLEVTVVGGTDAQAQDITASVRYTSDAPQLCVDLTVDRQCPTARAIYPTPGVPASDMTIDGAATASGTDTVTTPLSTSVTRADMSGCLGTVGGTVTRATGGSGTPISDATVQLLGPADAVVSSTTTDLSGHYSFANVVPAGYTVRGLGQDASATIAAGSTAAASLSVPVAPPVASPVHGNTLQSSPATLAIDASADPAATIDPTTLVLRDGSSWVHTLAVDGEGTWETVGGNLRFTPEMGFSGRSRTVTYGVSDSFGTRAQAGAYVDVAAVLPTAGPIDASGVQGDTLSLTPAGTSPSVPLDPSATRLVDPADGSAVTTLVVNGRGTYTVDGTSGRIAFVPESGFTGAHTVVYRVMDVTGRTASAVATVTLTPIVLRGDAATVTSGGDSSVSVSGIPSGATVTVPGAVPGASSVVISGGVVRVTPKDGFSGTIYVPVTVVNGSTTLQVIVVVYVHPQRVVRAGSTLALHGSTIRWGASPTSSVTSYRVFVNNRLVCTTSAISCAYAKLVGPRTRVRVQAIGGDSLTSATVAAPYTFSRCSAVADVHFSTASAALSKRAKRHIAAIAAQVRAAGFRHVCLVGFTDSRGSALYNKRLSSRRVQAVQRDLSHRVRHVAVRPEAKGERHPLRDNRTPWGRWSNRRVMVGLG